MSEGARDLCQAGGSDTGNLILQAMLCLVSHQYGCVGEREQHKQIRFALTIQKATVTGAS